jgi:hypothetical protein
MALSTDVPINQELKKADTQGWVKVFFLDADMT